MNLTPWQRIKRRLSLVVRSSYTHPDGTIELDIDAAAGIDPTVDSKEVQDAKLARYNAWQAARDLSHRRIAGAILVGAAIYYLAGGVGLSTWEAIGVGAAVGYGALLLTN